MHLRDLYTRGRAFAARDKTGVELAWWHANYFPQHRFADVFDEVIGNALAIGVVWDETDGAMRQVW